MESGASRIEHSLSEVFPGLVLVASQFFVHGDDLHIRVRNTFQGPSTIDEPFGVESFCLLSSGNTHSLELLCISDKHGSELVVGLRRNGEKSCDGTARNRFSQVAFPFVQHSIEMGMLNMIFLAAGSPIIPWIPVTLLLVVLLGVFLWNWSSAVSVDCIFSRLELLMGILLQVWMFATPIVYDDSLLEDRVPAFGLTILKWNPMVFFRCFRANLYSGRGTEAKDFAASACCSIEFCTWIALFQVTSANSDTPSPEGAIWPNGAKCGFSTRASGEMADALASGTSVPKDAGVRVSPLPSNSHRS